MMAFSGSENIGTSEYDQNAVLAELDRVLRSPNLAEKCYGILKLPQYFDKYPFPVFITAAFLKLVEAFRNGTNVTRKWILHVAERSENHLDKVISRDELMKRILTVSHSNDPNARALTMKLFAYFARILADRKQMHHLVCTGLDSNDNGELLAAIFAAQHFAKHSPDFGRSVLDKTMEMLLSIDVPPETKLLLVPIFEHFYSDAQTSLRAITFCRDHFLPQCHSSAVTGALLSSLTKLSVHAVTIAPLQLQLLLSRLKSRTTSQNVKMMALECLHYLAKEMPHLWTSDAIRILCNHCTEDTDGPGSIVRGLRVLSTLTKSRVVCLWNDEDIRLIIDLCSKYCHDQSEIVLSVACVVAMNMVENLADGTSKDELVNILILSLITAIAIWPWGSDNDELASATKSILRCSLKLAKLDSVTAGTISRSLVSVTGQCSELNQCAFTECILALCDTDLSLWECLKQIPFDTPLGQCLALAPRSTVQLIENVPVSAEQLIDQCSDDWQLFKLGRRALRYGYTTVAKRIFGQLQEKVESPHYRNWSKSLATLATAETVLTNSTSTPLDCLTEAIYHYQLATICMKAAVTPTHSLWFPIAYIQLRQRFLSAVNDLRTAWNVAVLVPPTMVPTAGSSQTNNSGLLSQVTKCEKRFSDMVLDYESLTRRCFDADEGTIDLLTLLRTQCFLVQQAIRSVTGTKERKSYKVTSSEYNAQTRITSKHLEWLADGVNRMWSDFAGSITVQNIDYLFGLLDRICFQLPFFLPRFFFQSLQTSTVRLSLLPKPTDRDNSVRLLSDQRLLVNVEGVVSVSGSKTRILRRIERVIVRISAQHSGPALPYDDKVSMSMGNVVKLEKAVPLRNDYFSADFMLDFPSSGLVNVHIDLVDSERGIVWDGNAEQQLKVKVLSTGEQHVGPIHRHYPRKRNSDM